LGGNQATVTDAYVCLGIIDPDRFLGGAVTITPRLAHDDVGTIAAAIGLDTLAAAESMLRVATSQMYATLVPLLARKGISYDDFALLPFGGAGPTHGFLLAREVGIRRVVVPLHPGVLCAAGSLAADVRRDFIRTIHGTVARDGAAPVVRAMRDALGALAHEGGAWLDRQGLAFVGRRIDWSADIRYLGQSFELTIPLDPAVLADGGGGALRERFGAIYEQIYGYRDEAAVLEVLDVRASAVGITQKPKLASVAMRGAPAARSAGARTRRLFLDGRFWEARVFDRDGLPAGAHFEGPAVVEQYDTTTLVPPGFAVTVDRFGNLIGEAQA
jgi:N-methylhydantoinase A